MKKVIDWTNLNEFISKYFTVHEATFLPSWGVHHIPTDEEKENILKMAEKADLVREFIGLPMHIHCWIRPIKVNPSKDIKLTVFDISKKQLDALKALNYNAFVGSVSTQSGHIYGLALDFNSKGYNTAGDCEEIRLRLLPKLAEFCVRMENIEGSWIHIDCLPVKYNRFFKP